MLCSLCSSIFPWYKHSMVRSELFIMFILWSNDINISSDKTQPFFALFYRLLVLGSQDLLAALQRLRQLLPGGLRSTNRDEVWPRLASCSWWNHRKTIGQWWFDGIFYGIYHLVMTNIAMDNGPFSMTTLQLHHTWRAEKWTIEICDFPMKRSIDRGLSIPMFDYQRVKGPGAPPCFFMEKNMRNKHRKTAGTWRLNLW